MDPLRLRVSLLPSAGRGSRDLGPSSGHRPRPSCSSPRELFLCKKLSAIGDLLVQGSDPLTGLDPVARKRLAPESVLQVAGVLHAYRLAAKVASVARVSTTPVEPGALLAALRGALDGDRGTRAPSAVDDLAGLRLAFIARLAAHLHEPHPGHAQATMATAFAGHKSPAVAMRLVPQPLKRSSALKGGNKRLSVAHAPQRLEGPVKALERHLRALRRSGPRTSRPHGEER